MATLVAYAFTGSVLTPTTTLPNVTGSAITSSATTVISIGTTFGYATQPVIKAQSGSTSYAGALSAGDYILFTLTVAAGFQIGITGFSLSAARGGSSTPRGIGIRSSADSFAADLMPDTVLTTVRPTFATYTSSPSLTALTGTVTIRIYCYNNATGSVEMDDITVTGTVTTTASNALPSPVDTNGALARRMHSRGNAQWAGPGRQING